MYTQRFFLYAKVSKSQSPTLSFGPYTIPVPLFSSIFYLSVLFEASSVYSQLPFGHYDAHHSASRAAAPFMPFLLQFRRLSATPEHCAVNKTDKSQSLSFFYMENIQLLGGGGPSLSKNQIGIGEILMKTFQQHLSTSSHLPKQSICST